MTAAETPAMFSLAGRRGLVLGIANENSIATGCARAFAACGAALGITYLNDKARPYVAEVAQTLPCDFLLPCDVSKQGALEAVFAEIERKWGKLDFLLHSIAFAPAHDLHGRVVDSSAEGFAQAMDISCHSFLRAAHLAAPLMADGGTLLAVTYLGSERVVPNYNLMGPVKAALESAVRYAAAELGPQRIRVHAISPGPIATRAASGIPHFGDLLSEAAQASPARRLATIEDCGGLAAFLVSDAAQMLTGTVIPIDGGQHLLA